MIIDPFTGIAHWEAPKQSVGHIAYVNKEGVLTDPRTGRPELIQPTNIYLHDEAAE